MVEGGRGLARYLVLLVERERVAVWRVRVVGERATVRGGREGKVGEGIGKLGV